MGPGHGSGGSHEPMGSHTPMDHGYAGAPASGASSSTASLEQWFANVDNFEAVTDRTDRAAVTVVVGADGNGGAFAYAPPAIRVTSGTPITWEWSGEGGSHDVVAVDGSFASALQADSGATFTHTFERPGVYRYYCTPHRSLGMKGAVLVE